MSYLYRTYIKLILHRKRFYLWNLIFPLLFSVLLFYVFNNLNGLRDTGMIRVGFLSEQKNDTKTELENQMRTARNSENELIFEVKEINAKDAVSILSNQQMDAYIEVSDQIQIKTQTNGLKQSMIQTYIDQYRQFREIYESMENEKDQVTREEYLSLLGVNDEHIEVKQLELKSMWIYFYILIGMSCFNCVTFGFFLARLIFTEESKIAERLYCTPVGKGKRFLSGFFASATVAIGFIAVLLWFLHTMIGIPLEFNDRLVWETVVLGVFNSILIGYCFGGLLRRYQAWSESIPILLASVCTFLAGIVRVDLRYQMQQKIGFGVYFNPVHVISDALYCIYYQENYWAFFVDLAVLGVLLFLLIIITIVLTGRRAYDHI